MMGRYGDWGYGQMMNAGFGLGWIFTVIIGALLIWAAVAFVRGGKCWDGRCDYRDKEEDSALKILRERYAKGELNKEEFEKMRNNLENMR